MQGPPGYVASFFILLFPQAIIGAILAGILFGILHACSVPNLDYLWLWLYCFGFTFVLFWTVLKCIYCKGQTNLKFWRNKLGDKLAKNLHEGGETDRFTPLI
jgi:hypothetical protein